MVCSECAAAEESCLSCAVTNGGLELVKRLLAEGANAKDLYCKKILLYSAIEGGHIAVAKLLIERGSDVECRDR